MMESGFEFYWFKPVAGGGFRWVPARLRDLPSREAEQLVLVQERGAQLGLYNPLDVDGLFLTFADLAADLTPSTVLTFAAKYGCLGEGWPLRPGSVAWDEVLPPLNTYAMPKTKTAEDVRQWKAEPFALWRDEVTLMNHLVTLWGYATAGDDAALKELVRWDGDTVVFRLPPSEPFILDLIGWDKGEIAWPPEDYATPDGPLFKRGELQRPAKVFVQEHLSRALKGRSVTYELAWSVRHDRPVLQARPPSLLGALFFQFAKAVTDPEGGFRYSHCQRCGKRMALAPGVNRADRTTCSDSCRALLYRQRQKQARQLHAAGKTAKEIAQELGSNAKTVKGWVSKRKGE
jgi:hypothetical protein